MYFSCISSSNAFSTVILTKTNTLIETTSVLVRIYLVQKIDYPNIVHATMNIPIFTLDLSSGLVREQLKL